MKLSFRSAVVVLTVVVLVASSMGLTLAGGAEAFASQTEFKDVPQSHWAHGSIAAMADKGIVKGYPDGSFKPLNTVTYAEFIKMAVVAITGTDPGTAQTGQMGGATHWASSYYKAAVDAGLFSTTQIGENLLGARIPRADMALIAANAIKAGELKNYDELSKKLSDISGNDYEYQILQSFENGIITGYEDGTFRPNGTLTRAESAAVITRLTDETARVSQSGNSVVSGENAGNLEKDYVIVKTTDYISNTSEYLENRTSEVWWSEDARLYNSGYLPGHIKVEHTWEEMVQKSKDHPQWNLKPFMSFGIDSDEAIFVGVVKDNKIIEVPTYYPDWANGCGLVVYTHPADYDYIVFADTGKNGSEICRLYPNPFK